MRFVDTNVLLYAVSTADDERIKSERAQAILSRRDLALSVQVLQEFYVQATRSDKPETLSHEQTVHLIDALLRFPVQESQRRWCKMHSKREPASESRTGTQPSSKLQGSPHEGGLRGRLEGSSLLLASGRSPSKR
jgi:predicted nucleic acid-binding protein